MIKRFYNIKKHIRRVFLCTTFVAGVSASNLLEPISAYLNHGITVEYNDVDQVMLDANGGKVIPITYNGSTYLPVRAVSNMLGVPVNWDQATQTVLLGNSFPDVVAPVTPVTPTPQLPTPNSTTVPTVVNSTQVDIGFVFDIFNKYAPNKYEVDRYFTENGDIVGTVLQGTAYDAGPNDIAYSFYGVEFDYIGDGGNPALDLVENEIANVLTANGYTHVHTDEHGQKHFVNNQTEIKIWDVLGDNSTLRIEVETRWLSCHAKHD